MEIGASHDSFASQQTAAPSQASSPNVGMRLPIALHVQQLPPFSAFASQAQQQSEHLKLSGSGYGPPVSSALSPVQAVVRDVVQVRKEYDLVCVALTNSRWRERWERLCLLDDDNSASASAQSPRKASNRPSVDRSQGPYSPGADVEAEQWRSGGGFRRTEVNMTRGEETQGVIGMVSEWLELDSEVEGIRFDSEIALKQEISYASHVHIPYLILPSPRNPEYVTDYARAINAALAASPFIHLAVRLPISNPLPTGTALDETSTSPWETWNVIRNTCAYSNRLHLALDLSTPLPAPDTLDRWLGENIRTLWLPAASFIGNAKGYPVLSKHLQAFLRKVLKFSPTVILTGTEKGLHPNGGANAYPQYLRFLERKLPGDTPIEQYAGGYMDYLQAPLQPLMDNLETDTYEGFEKDPIKYQQYEEAVYRALMDRRQNPAVPVEIFVCGAGRGPLVAGCFKAAKRAGDRYIKVTAVEKNPNAYVILQERKAIEWGNAVDLAFSDMRSFRPGHQADIIVSELLGSFGDNELSPECLDGVIPRLLKPNGISIPSSYTAFVAPISSAKLHEMVTHGDEVSRAEKPYVVMFHQASIVSAENEQTERVQSCWSFQHPRSDIVLDEDELPITNSHNTRTANLSFFIPHATVCHGFGGYFEAVLYQDVGLSIHPERGDQNMLSWFPIFFPLREPIYLPARSELDVHMFRLTDQVQRRIWFEWSAEAFLPLPAPYANTSSYNAKTQMLSPPQPATPSVNWSDAFASAPSPVAGQGTSQAASGFEAAQQELTSSAVRVRIGLTKLHNPNARSSWVRL